MATFTVIDAGKAPRPARTPTSLAKRMEEYNEYANSVKKGQVGKLAPEQGETARALALRISRAGRRGGKAVETWIVDDVVYFRVAD